MSIKQKISIVTVCYNSIDTIERTIQSVLAQDYDNIEYIVIDGGSTDGTVEVIKKYADCISHWISEPDNGIYDAMNKGIALATGEWIHFRNSGDFFLRRESLTKFFLTPIAEDIMVVHGNCIYYDDSGWFEQTPPSLRVSYKKEIPVLHPASFVRASVQKKIPFDLQYRSSADYDFFYKCCQEGLKYEYRPIAIVAFAEGGFSSNWERAFWEDCKLQGLTNTPTGKLHAYLLFFQKKLMYICSKLKEHTFLANLHFHRRKASVLSIKRHPLPVPSDF